MKKIIIIDYDCGNILSLQRAIEKIGYKSEVTRDKKIISKASHVILPGVGAFGNAMSLLNKYNLIDPIKEHVQKNHFLGFVWECNFCSLKAQNLENLVV